VGKNLKIEMKDILHHADELGTVIGDNNMIGSRVNVLAGKMITTRCSITSGAKISRDIDPDSIVL
jgi:UDP-N-acetylglucosamine diphosphorylase / glucose-1-phosphate thymidylyltransferase / UDP-N-acetylgalactosamine diphosphorylase / glucosamine-1-phosphate N-acetyltransferase / galactosamine-1-phosphate N-acetyltransferase